jgi:hypothetical protein
MLKLSFMETFIQNYYFFQWEIKDEHINPDNFVYVFLSLLLCNFAL